MDLKKRIGLVAHDGLKHELRDWVKFNEQTLSRHFLFATGTTGHQLMEACPSLAINSLKSGPLGGDQQLGALISEGKLDILIFFTDPMTIQPHDVDVKALTRMCSVYNIVLATTRSTADFIINSSFFERESYTPLMTDYESYIHRQMK